MPPKTTYSHQNIANSQNVGILFLEDNATLKAKRDSVLMMKSQNKEQRQQDSRVRKLQSIGN